MARHYSTLPEREVWLDRLYRERIDEKLTLRQIGDRNNLSATRVHSALKLRRILRAPPLTPVVHSPSDNRGPAMRYLDALRGRR